MKKLITSNHAVAVGAYHSGVSYVSGYPGTPCTEVLSELRRFKEVECEWSTNEKVALEVAIGTSLAGYRSLVVMKTLGLNVAADAFTQLAGTPLNGGLVLVVADDIGRIAGDDYQDCRSYGIMAQVPVIEPANSQEAYDSVSLAFQMSETYETPVILRLNGILCKSKTLVKYATCTWKKHYRRPHEKSLQKTVGNIVKFGFHNCDNETLKPYWKNFDEEWKAIKEQAETTELNRETISGSDIGIIASGVAYEHAREVLPHVSYLKLGLVYPLPRKKIESFVNKHKKVFILEDGHPLIEKEIKSYQLPVIGVEAFPRFPEMLHFTPGVIEEKILGKMTESRHLEVPLRLPDNCPGCPHHLVNDVIEKHNIYTSSGIGCGGLGALPHKGVIDVIKCMGSSIGIAHGYNKALDKNKQMLSIMGDGEFWHSGINNLINMVLHESTSTIVIEDNMTIAMTGGQATITPKDGGRGSIEAVCKAIGVEDVQVINPRIENNLENTIKLAMDSDQLSVIISRSPCVLF